MTNLIVKIFAALFIFSTALFAQPAGTDSSASPVNEDFVMHKSPWTAVGLSAVLPGAGQIYNESYIKAPIIWGIGAALIAGWIRYHEQYWDYKRLYSASGNPNYITLRDGSRDNRDLFTIYLSLAYLLNLVDAYVDAHLFDFTVQENFSTKQPMFGIRLNF